MISHKEEAGALHLALTWGYGTQEEAIEWADKIILEEDHPPYEIIDVSFSKSKAETISLLKSMSRPANNWNALRLFLKRFDPNTDMDFKSVSALARCLYRKCAYYDDCPEDMKCFSHHWDSIDLAESGYLNLTKEEAIFDFLLDAESVAYSKPRQIKTLSTTKLALEADLNLDKKTYFKRLLNLLSRN